MSKECPYKGLVPYGEEDSRYFFGRDRERRVISAALRASRLTVLYGESGAGKSSVLAAGVAHDLRDDPEYALVMFRDWHDEPTAGLVDATRGLLSKLPGFAPNGDKGTPDDLGTLFQAWARDTKRVLLIVLDQFEEYFQYHSNDKGPRALAEELPRILSRADLPVNFLISIREDMLSLLDRFKGIIPSLFDNLLRVEHLTSKAAQEAIVNPLKKFNEDLRTGRFSASDNSLHAIEIEDHVAEKVVGEIVTAQGEEQTGVQAPYLQLVMTRWWEREIERKSQAMRLETLQGLGGVKTIVERYLEDTLSTLNPGEKEVVAEAFRYMVTPTGRRIAQTTNDLTKNLLSYLSLAGTSLEDILSGLQVARLLRKVPPPRGSPPNEACYEFAHDVVAKAALQWRRQFRRTQELANAKKNEEEANRRAAEQARVAEAERQLALKANLLAEESEKRAQAERQRAEEQRRRAEIEAEAHQQALALAESERRRAEEQALRARAEEKARLAGRLRRLVWGLAVVTVAAVYAAGFAAWQSKRARVEREMAEVQRLRANEQAALAAEKEQEAIRQQRQAEGLAKVYFARASLVQSDDSKILDAVSDLTELVKNEREDSRVRRAAAEALGWVPMSRVPPQAAGTVVSALLAAKNDPSIEVKQEALKSSERLAPVTRAKIQVNVYGGNRQPLHNLVNLLVRIIDGNQNQLSADFHQGQSVPVPVFNNFRDNYTVLVSADGYRQVGFTPVRVSAGTTAVLDFMLFRKGAGFNFQKSDWATLHQTHPNLVQFLASGASSEADAQDRFEDLMKNSPASLASLFNLTTVMAQTDLPRGTPLDYLKRLIWEGSLTPELFFAWADRALIDQVKTAAAQGEFVPESNPSFFHPGATSSFKMVQYGEANLQLTFYENRTRIIDGVECIKVESALDYHKDLGAHALVEVVANTLTGDFADPKVMYQLRWMAGRRAGVPEFNPPYTIE